MRFFLQCIVLGSKEDNFIYFHAFKIDIYNKDIQNTVHNNNFKHVGLKLQSFES